MADSGEDTLMEYMTIEDIEIVKMVFLGLGASVVIQLMVTGVLNLISWFKS